MIRKRTKALANLRTDLKRSERLLKIERSTFPDPPKTTYQRIGVEGLRGGAVVLMAATFEAYLKDVFLEVVQELENRRGTSKKVTLSSEFILAHDFDGLEAVMRDKQGNKSTRHSDLRRVARAIARGELVGDGFARTEANPRPEVVSKMLKRFGVNEPFKELATKAAAAGLTHSETYLRTKLDEILDRRNEVAHQGVSLNVTRLQLAEYVSFISDLCTVIDAAIVDRFKKICL
ncbi:MAE_28990/MAE_18760 family HEPN-like nuclease [Devosia nitrariae]|uniref:RiboL-PSP-HEPN domain-containing protein n=1 Tax=Devosia nitrariae TaxID=2071872 RepID=A0ABQ5VYE1_9HYPH|nr:MAE_28990/MAE_18760 family HEPN-like nuclease [Devosia nitrariae]GLQ52783.1 hypothetical protein GCM10010862_00410 [Devosia nitrariae]